MIECVAFSTMRPTLFTVLVPLLFWEDRPGFDCMLQHHMKEGVDHDCTILNTLFQVVKKSITPPVFSLRAGNYTCLTRVSVTPIGTPGDSWCDKVIDVTEWTNMSSVNVDRELNITIVRLALPIVISCYCRDPIWVGPAEPRQNI